MVATPRGTGLSANRLNMDSPTGSTTIPARSVQASRPTSRLRADSPHGNVREGSDSRKCQTPPRAAPGNQVAAWRRSCPASTPAVHNRPHGPEKHVGHLLSKSGQGCLVGGTHLAAIESNRPSRLAESAPVQPAVRPRTTSLALGPEGRHLVVTCHFAVRPGRLYGQTGVRRQGDYRLGEVDTLPMHAAASTPRCTPR